MPTAAETKAANTDYTLPIADALNIHTAIHAPGSFFVKLSNGISLPIVVSANGSRRVDLIVDHKRPKGRAPRDKVWDGWSGAWVPAPAAGS